MKKFIALSLALLVWLLPAPYSSAAVVSWGFSGVLTYVTINSNSVPSSVAVGTPFTGTITYDTAGAGPDSNPSPNFGNHYFVTNSTFSISIQAGGVTFTSTNRSPDNNFAVINIADNLANSYDEIVYEAGGPPLINGAPAPASVTEGALNLQFSDNNKTAFTSDAIPMGAPNLGAYTQATITVNGFTENFQATVFYIEGDITEISPLPKVVLSSQKLPGNQLRLSWPKASTGLTLQFATSLSSQDWTTEPTPVVDTATEHTVTVSTTGQPKFFRLVKLP